MKFHWVVVVVALIGCEKGKEPTWTAQPEVKPTANEVAMLEHLPGGNVALFGGNYMRLQKYLVDSPLSRLMGAVSQSTGTNMTEWMNCFVEAKNVTMLGAVRFDGSQADMRMAMTGMDVAQVEACAKRSGFATQIDADQKFVSIEFPSLKGTMKGGYLVAAPGVLYSRVSMPFSAIATGVPPAIDRAALEADLASIATTGSAAKDEVLVSQMATVNRSRSVWMVASAAGTPIADKVGTARLMFDFGNGIDFDLTVQVRDKALADQISDGMTKMKEQSASMGGALQAVLLKLKYSRSGDQLRVQLAIDNAELDALMKQLAPFMQGASGIQ